MNDVSNEWCILVWMFCAKVNDAFLYQSSIERKINTSIMGFVPEQAGKARGCKAVVDLS